MKYEWDPKKAFANQQKHNVTFEEATTIFSDPLAITFEYPDHSIVERRYLTYGMSCCFRLLVVSHVDRKDRLRIISARLATRKERIFYEQG